MNRKIVNYKELIINFLLVLFDSLLIGIISIFALLVCYNFRYNNIPLEAYHNTVFMIIPNIIITIILIYIFKLGNSLLKYISIHELTSILAIALISTGLNIYISLFFYNEFDFKYSFYYFLFLFIFLTASRYRYKIINNMFNINSHASGRRNTMIIGAGDAGCIVLNELRFSKNLVSDVKCIIDDDIKKHGKYFMGVKVVGGRDSIEYYAKKYNINEIIIAIPSAPKSEIKDISDICMNVENCDIKILPGIYQLVNGSVSVSKIRNLKIEDLLGREQVSLLDNNIKSYLCSKTVLVTGGGGGSIGSELCRQIAANGVNHLIVFDIYENNAYQLQQELIKYFPNLKLTVLIGSVRNRERLHSIFKMYRPDIVYHAAAHKHVPLMEDSPNEAIKNNVFGTYEVALASYIYKVEKFVLISTDKAVNPTNVMGASKRICEMIVQFFNKLIENTEYSAVRFGNVLGSNGSVIPLFKTQIENGGPVTITHPDIIRYFMTIEEAVFLVLRAGSMNNGRNVFILDMGAPVKIVDLAEKMIKLCGYEPYTDIPIEFIGLRPGEKLYEEPLTDLENLKKTDDKKIFVEPFTDIDPEKFISQLEKLYESAYNESPNIKRIICDIVDTYKPEFVEDELVCEEVNNNCKWDSYLDKMWLK